MTKSGEQRRIYTIGHSTHRIEYFVSLLERHGIDTVMDVRSVPYRSRQPQFDRRNLIGSLRSSGIKYVFLGRSLGWRSDNPELYEDGRIKYRLLAETSVFKRGIRRVRKGSEHGNIVLMCAQEDPLDCHRTIFVARELAKKGEDVGHILSDGQVKTHDVMMEHLVKRLGLRRQMDLFLTERQMEKNLVDEACSIQERRIACSDRKPAWKAREIST